MVKALLDGSYDGVQLYHVRMAFSEDMESIGRFAFRKLAVLLSTIIRIWYARLRYRTPTLYYPPAGPNTVPVLRDLALLITTRWLFRYTVFHFHAGGVSGFGHRLPAMVRPFFHWAYRRPSLAIRTAPQNPDDGAVFGAKRNVVIPNGIPDLRGTVAERTSGPGEPLVILFTGVLVRSKGVMVLLEAFRSLRSAGRNIQLQLMGRWGDTDVRRECSEFMDMHGIREHVVELGVLDGELKQARFASCDIFCFPSFFEAESFGLVVVEAMVFAKPVVSTYWRGIPSVVEDGSSGLLVPVKDAVALEEKLGILLDDPQLRVRMGAAGRRIFEKRFTLEAFRHSMERELKAITDKDI